MRNGIIFVDADFGKPNRKKKPSNRGEKRVGKWIEKPLTLSDRNNDHRLIK